MSPAVHDLQRGDQLLGEHLAAPAVVGEGDEGRQNGELPHARAEVALQRPEAGDDRSGHAELLFGALERGAMLGDLALARLHAVRRRQLGLEVEEAHDEDGALLAIAPDDLRAERGLVDDGDRLTADAARCRFLAEARLPRFEVLGVAAVLLRRRIGRTLRRVCAVRGYGRCGLRRPRLSRGAESRPPAALAAICAAGVSAAGVSRRRERPGDRRRRQGDLRRGRIDRRNLRGRVRLRHGRSGSGLGRRGRCCGGSSRSGLGRRCRSGCRNCGLRLASRRLLSRLLRFEGGRGFDLGGGNAGRDGGEQNGGGGAALNFITCITRPSAFFSVIAGYSMPLGVATSRRWDPLAVRYFRPHGEKGRFLKPLPLSRGGGRCYLARHDRTLPDPQLLHHRPH